MNYFRQSVGFIQEFFSCIQQIHVISKLHSSYMLDNQEFTVQFYFFTFWVNIHYGSLGGHIKSRNVSYRNYVAWWAAELLLSDFRYTWNLYSQVPAEISVSIWQWCIWFALFSTKTRKKTMSQWILPKFGKILW